MPNGHDEERRRMREAGRIWYTVFLVGDFLWSIAPLVLLIGPVAGMGAMVANAGSEGWLGALQRIGLALGVALVLACLCAGLGSALVRLARWRAGM